MKKKISIIVGGSGQFGLILSNQLIKKNHSVIITTRNVAKTKNKINYKSKNLKLRKLNVLKMKEINKLLDEYNPNYIFYFAGLSSPGLSFQKPKETFSSNYNGCKNFLEAILLKKLRCKFLNASSCEIFAKTTKKLSLLSKKKPISPYGKSKLMSFNITKKYRNDYNLKTYNAIIFNTESIYRKKNFLIPKICIAAINAFKKNKSTYFGDLNISREWNWCEEQVKYLLRFINKKPQDFMLSNQKIYSAKEMLSFAFKYFNLNYKRYVFSKKQFTRPADFKTKKSDCRGIFKRNNIKYNYKVYGKKIITMLIRHYQNEI